MGTVPENEAHKLTHMAVLVIQISELELYTEQAKPQALVLLIEILEKVFVHLCDSLKVLKIETMENYVALANFTDYNKDLKASP